MLPRPLPLPLLRPLLARLTLLALASSSAPLGCADLPPPPALVAQALAPASAAPGDVVSVYGRGFGIEGEEDGVWLSGERLEVRYWSDERIDARLSPVQPAGSWLLVVRANGAVTPPLTLEVRAP